MISYRHRLFGLAIECDLPLPGAPRVEHFDGPADVTISWTPEPPEVPEPDEGWKTVVTSDDARADIHECDDGCICLAWGHVLHFVISAQRDRIQVRCCEARRQYVPTVIVGFVLGYLLHLRGALCLHGAVLMHNGQTFAVMGDSGIGKSTVAAALVRHGAKLLSDDMVVFSRTAPPWAAEGGCRSLRLNTDTASHILGDDETRPRVPYLDKIFWDVSDGASQSAEAHDLCAQPLSRLYILQTNPECRDLVVEPPLAPGAALPYLNLALYPPGYSNLITPSCLHAMWSLAAAVPLQIVRYPKRWDMLAPLIARICP